MAKGWLEGKTAVVTGSGRGIGRGIALLFAHEGANVVVNDLGGEVDGTGRDEGPATEVVAEIRAAGGTAVANFDSVATAEGCESLIKLAVETFGRLDILVNNAGILRDRMVFNMTEEEWDAVVAVHLHGQFHTVRAAAPLMREQRYGRIINTSSMSGLEGNAGQANYGSAKVGVIGLTKAVARDLGPYGITCNAVASAGRTRLGQNVPPGRRGGQEGERPMPAPGEGHPDDAAPLVCYLASDAAWNVNGLTFRASGGTIALLHNPESYRGIYKSGVWSLDELDLLVPRNVLAGVVNAHVSGIANPAPPAEDIDVPGRPAPEPKEAQAET